MPTATPTDLSPAARLKAKAVLATVAHANPGIDPIQLAYEAWRQNALKDDSDADLLGIYPGEWREMAMHVLNTLATEAQAVQLGAVTPAELAQHRAQEDRPTRHLTTEAAQAETDRHPRPFLIHRPVKSICNPAHLMKTPVYPAQDHAPAAAVTGLTWWQWAIVGLGFVALCVAMVGMVTWIAGWLA